MLIYGIPAHRFLIFSQVEWSVQEMWKMVEGIYVGLAINMYTQISKIIRILKYKHYQTEVPLLSLLNLLWIMELLLSITCNFFLDIFHFKVNNVYTYTFVIPSLQGDSGGPLVCQIPGQDNWKLFGITSWGGVECGAVRVVTYIDWIQRTLRHATEAN